MNILENALIKKYFGKLSHCTKNHNFDCDCRKDMSFRILQAMSDPINKEERYLKVNPSGAIYETATTDLSDGIEGFHPDCLRLPQQFQPQAEKKDIKLIGEFDAMKWAKEFCRITGFKDEEFVHSWFASAIMTGYDNANQKKHAEEKCDLDCEIPSHNHKTHPSDTKAKPPESDFIYRAFVSDGLIAEAKCECEKHHAKIKFCLCHCHPLNSDKTKCSHTCCQAFKECLETSDNDRAVEEKIREILCLSPSDMRFGMIEKILKELVTLARRSGK